MQAKPFRCEHPDCDKSFSTKFSLRRHSATHLDERPFKCNYCEKSFVLRQYLKEHIYTHTGEKPFVCRICGKSFRQAGKLSIHRKLHLCMGEGFSNTNNSNGSGAAIYHFGSSNSQDSLRPTQLAPSKFNLQPMFPSSWVPVTQPEVPPLQTTDLIRRPSHYQQSTFSQSPGHFVPPFTQEPLAPSAPACPANTSLTDTLKNILFVQEKITLALCLRLKQIELQRGA